MGNTHHENRQRPPIEELKAFCGDRKIDFEDLENFDFKNLMAEYYESYKEKHKKAILMRRCCKKYKMR